MPTVQSWWNYVLLCGYAVYLGYTNRALCVVGRSKCLPNASK